jgi:hypothetical protein
MALVLRSAMATLELKTFSPKSSALQPSQIKARNARIIHDLTRRSEKPKRPVMRDLTHLNPKNIFVFFRSACGNRHFLKTLLMAVGLSLTSCLATESSSSSSSIPAITVDLGFSGVSSVANLNASTLKISWTVATSTAVVGYRVYERLPDGTLSALIETSHTTASYNHSGLTAGTYHNYVVRALNDKGLTDGNTIFKGAYTFAGITSATITGTTTATINFPAAGSFASGVNIYATARGATTLLGTVSNSATTYSATGLRSGTAYRFSVKSYDVNNAEDANAAAASGQTTSLSSTRYRGPLLVQAYGDASGAPSGTPAARQVSITWLPFTSATTSTTYTLVRTAKDATFDMNTTTACTSTTSTSCRVCTATGITAQTCTDTNVGATPNVYDYAVTLNSYTNWPEDLPTSGSNPYRITVAIPPDNMVLVHRDSANYEMCQLMNRTSDPLNHQRCPYAGLGAVAYSIGPTNGPLNLDPNFYDLGYNFFIDRWEAGCNWTTQANSGMCGAGATAGNCFGNVDPASTIGAPGNVYYRTDTGTCSYKRTAGAAWITANSSSLTAEERAIVYTAAPNSGAGRRPPLTQVDQNRSWDFCQSVTEVNYGQKRLLRNRESKVAAAWQSLTGEPNALSDTVIDGMENGSTYAHSAGNYSCNSSTHSGIAAGAFTTTNLAGDAGDAIASFTLGSLETSKCVSRFGAQDLVGNVWEWTSDQMTCSNVSHTCSGANSALDIGNGYSAGFDMQSFLFNGIQGPGGTSAGQVGPNYTAEWPLTGQNFSAANFSFPLGLPLVGTDSGYSNTIASKAAKFHGDYFYLFTDNGNTSRGLFVSGAWSNGSNAGRWISHWYDTPLVTHYNIGFRCALPAE